MASVADGSQPYDFFSVKIPTTAKTTAESELLLQVPSQLFELHPQLRSRLQSLFKEHESLLGDAGELRYPDQAVVQHRIDEDPGSRPRAQPQYWLSPQQVVELKGQLKKLLDAKLVEPSSSPYAAPVLFAPKKDGTLRMCCDYRALNHQTVKDRFPLPHPEDLFDRMRDC